MLDKRKIKEEKTKRNGLQIGILVNVRADELWKKNQMHTSPRITGNIGNTSELKCYDKKKEGKERKIGWKEAKKEGEKKRSTDGKK